MAVMPASPRRAPFVRRPGSRALATAGLIVAAFVAGRLSDDVTPQTAAAAALQQDDPLDDALLARIRAGFDELRRAQLTLEQTGRYRPAANGVNAFITLAGGYDVLNSLENGRGVDPETYAALEAGFAPQPVLAELGRDAEGRLTYKKNLVRLLPRETLRALYMRRAETLSEAL